MEIQTKTKKNSVTLNLHGDIDSYNSSVLKDIITSRMNKNELDITVDMADVGHIGAEAIDVLLVCSADIKQRNGSLKVINGNKLIKTV